MALDQITSQAIADGAISAGDLADGSITHAKLHTTAIQDKLGYTPVSPTQLTTEVNNLINAAPGALNTLGELATALGNDASFATTVTNALSLKANTSSLSTVATSGSYSDLTNKPTIPTNTNQLTNGAGFLSSAVTSLNGSTGAVNLQDLSVFGRSISGSGYQKLPGGLWIQWGITSYIADYQRIYQAFPVSFPNACFSVTCQNVDSEDANWMDNLRAYDVTAAGFTMYRRGNNSRNWFIAIGY